MPRQRPLPAALHDAPETGAAPAVTRAETPLPATHDLDAIAVAAGLAWAAGTVGKLRAEDRAVSGGWPGTLREARGHVLVALSTHRGPQVSATQLDALARAAYASARSEWGAQAEPDLEV